MNQEMYELVGQLAAETVAAFDELAPELGSADVLGRVAGNWLDHRPEDLFKLTTLMAVPPCIWADPVKRLLKPTDRLLPHLIVGGELGTGHSLFDCIALALSNADFNRLLAAMEGRDRRALEPLSAARP